jgi:hypothetical protein
MRSTYMASLNHDRRAVSIQKLKFTWVQITADTGN